MFNSWPERIFSLCLSLRLQLLCNGCAGCEAVFPRRAVLCPMSDRAGARGRNVLFPELCAAVPEQQLSLLSRDFSPIVL